MHDSVRIFVQAQLEKINPPILEVGSYNVNGSVRDFCPIPYTGIDIVEGSGVDLVYDGYEMPFLNDSFATVISTEVFEHAHKPWILASEIVRVLQPNGWAIITARGNGFGGHNPPDRWRYMEGTLAEMFSDLGCETQESEDPEAEGRFLIARKVVNDQQKI